MSWTGGIASWLHLGVSQALPLPSCVSLGRWLHSKPQFPHISSECNSTHLTGLWRALDELINVERFLGSGRRLVLSVWEPIAGLESRPHHLPTGRPLSGPPFLRLGNRSDDLHRVILLGGGLCLHTEGDWQGLHYLHYGLPVSLLASTAALWVCCLDLTGLLC